jgi:hypothetical protein
MLVEIIVWANPAVGRHAIIGSMARIVSLA